MPASNRRTAGGCGWMWPSSRPTRRATTSFSLQVLTNSRYFWRLSKKRKFFSGELSTRGAGIGAGWLARISGSSSGGESPGPCMPCFWMKMLTRCSVSGVTRAPSRSRATNLPSFTARRPNVDSAMPVRRQKSEMLPNRVPLAGAATAASIDPSSWGKIILATLVGLQPQGVQCNNWDDSHNSRSYRPCRPYCLFLKMESQN